MLKAIVSYSKKVPVAGQEFSSQGYSLSLEAEVPETDPAAIQARLHHTFELVKSSVEQELANGHGNGHTVAKPQAVPQATSQAAPAGKPDTARASNKQIKFITDLATQRGVTISGLNARIQKRFGVQGLYDLGRKQASDLLDELNGSRKAA